MEDQGEKMFVFSSPTCFLSILNVRFLLGIPFFHAPYLGPELLDSANKPVVSSG